MPGYFTGKKTWGLGVHHQAREQDTLSKREKGSPAALKAFLRAWTQVESLAWGEPAAGNLPYSLSHRRSKDSAGAASGEDGSTTDWGPILYTQDWRSMHCRSLHSLVLSEEETLVATGGSEIGACAREEEREVVVDQIETKKFPLPHSRTEPFDHADGQFTEEGRPPGNVPSEKGV